MIDPACEGVRRHFDRSAARFDLIYDRDKNPVQRLVDVLFRGVIQHRFRLTLERCGDVTGRRVLDVGCGSGRYSIELARRGAHVVGLDFSAVMVQMAVEAAEVAQVSDRCAFEQADFLAWSHAEPFDIGFAMGFFDYVKPAERFVEHLAQQIEGRVFCSFPARWTLRTPTRWMRLRLSGCPVYFYSRREIERLFSPERWQDCRIDRLSRDYLVDCRTQ